VDEGVVLIAIVLNAVFVAGGVVIILMAMYQRMQTREMQHRERMAMIERGLVPPPETDLVRFEAMVRPPRAGVSRFTSLGVAIVGVGLGLMLIIGFAGGEPGVAVGIGGAIVVLGLAFIINGYLQRGAYVPPPVPPPPGWPRSPGPQGPAAP
jgi:hypothetical protein